MAKYETTVVVPKAGVEGLKTVVAIQVKSSRCWIWKTFAVIVFLCLCVVAYVFLPWHLIKIEQNSTPSGELDQTKKSLKWVSGVDQSFEQGGLKLIDNKNRIPADGLYFVYSQVAYHVPCKVGEDGDTQMFLSHNILRYSDEMGGQMPLQDSGHSICHSGENEKMTYSTIYVGAVFKLLQGDRLSTSTNNVDYIDDYSSKTFFGLFAL